MHEHEEYQVLFKRVPHIARHMLLLWGTDQFYKYVDKLFLDTRDGTRKGLPAAVASSIWKLYHLHEEEFPAMPREFPVEDSDSKDQDGKQVSKP